MNKIERAIEYFEDDSEMQCLWEHHNTPDLALDCIALALDALKEKLERENNPQLTLKQLKQMIGKYVWVKKGVSVLTVVKIKDFDGKYVVVENCFSNNFYIEINRYQFFKHNYEINEDEYVL